MCKTYESNIQYPNFEDCSKRLINDIVLTACGNRGLGARHTAIKFLQMYAGWRLNFSGNTLEPIYSHRELCFIIDYLKSLDEKRITNDPENNQFVSIEWMTQLTDQFEKTIYI